MHLRTRNVNSAFHELVSLFADSEWGETVRTTSRNGDVIQFVEPVTITYEQPRERVLFNKARDCNPFFHIFESIWMLAGSDKVDPVAFFTKNMRNYSDDGRTFNGAYGKRWRHALIGNGGTMNQLRELIKHLRAHPDSRRAVLQMWTVPQDLTKIGQPCHMCDGVGCQWCNTTGADTSYSKDVCCNLSVCFSIRQNLAEKDVPIGSQRTAYHRYLDMTVFNRSNDLILGCLGANVVHYSYLQEYMANCLGVQVGAYNQISNNLHVYTNNWHPSFWLKEGDHSNCYPQLVGVPPLVKERIQFDKECVVVTSLFDLVPLNFELLQVECVMKAKQLREPYLATVVMPMCQAFIAHKQRNYDSALFYASQVASPDWKRAGTEWLERRKANWQDKQKEGV